MYFVMFLIRFVLGMRDNIWGSPQLARVLASGATTCLQSSASRPTDWNVASGLMRVRTPMRSLTILGQLGSPPPTNPAQCGGRIDRPSEL